MDASTPDRNRFGRTAVRKTVFTEQRTQSPSPIRSSPFKYPLPDFPWEISPKTDYTYARSGSYDPKRIGDDYIMPNMTRPSLHGNKDITLPLQVMPSPIAASSVIKTQRSFYESSSSFLQHNLNNSGNQTPVDSDPRRTRANRSATRSGCPYGLNHRDGRMRRRQSNNQRESILLQQRDQSQAWETQAHQGSVHEGSHIRHLYGLDQSDDEEEHEPLVPPHESHSPASQHSVTWWTRVIMTITAIYTNTITVISHSTQRVAATLGLKDPRLLQQESRSLVGCLWAWAKMAPYAVYLGLCYIALTIRYIMTGPFIYIYQGVSDWWSSLETNSSQDEVLVQKLATRGASGTSEEAMDYLTTQTVTVREVITDEPMPGRQQLAGTYADTSDGEILHYQQHDNKESVSICHRLRSWAGTVAHSLHMLLYYTGLISFYIITGPFVYIYRGISDWWNSLETSSAKDEVVVPGSDIRGAQQEAGMDYLTTTTLTEKQVITDEALAQQRHLMDQVETKDTTVASTSGGSTEHQQSLKSRESVSWCTWLCEWLGVVLYTSLYILTGPIRWVCSSVSNLWHRLVDNQFSGYDHDELDMARPVPEDDSDELISDDEVTTTQTQITTEKMLGTGNRPRRRLARKMKMMNDAEEADSDSGYSDAGLDQEPQDLPLSACEQLLGWLVWPFQLLDTAITAPVQWTYSKVCTAMNWITNSDEDYDDTTRKPLWKTVSLVIASPFALLLYLVVAPFTWIWHRLKDTHAWFNSLFHTHDTDQTSSESLRRSSRRKSRTAVHADQRMFTADSSTDTEESLCSKLTKWLCWPFQASFYILTVPFIWSWQKISGGVQRISQSSTDESANAVYLRQLRIRGGDHAVTGASGSISDKMTGDESVCSRFLSWICWPFQLVFYVLTCPFLWIWSKIRNVGHSAMDETDAVYRTRKGKKSMLEKPLLSGQSLGQRTKTWITWLFQALFYIITAPFVYLWRVVCAPWHWLSTRMSESDTGAYRQSVGSAASRKRGADVKTSSESVWRRMWYWFCWPFMALWWGLCAGGRLLKPSSSVRSGSRSEERSFHTWFSWPFLWLWSGLCSVWGWMTGSGGGGDGAAAAAAARGQRAAGTGATAAGAGTSAAGRWWSGIKQAVSQVQLAEVWLMSRSRRRRGCGLCCLLPLLLLVPMAITAAYYAYDRGLTVLPLAVFSSNDTETWTETVLPAGAGYWDSERVHEAGASAWGSERVSDADLKLQVQQILVGLLRDREKEETAKREAAFASHTQAWESSMRTLVLQIHQETIKSQPGLTMEEVEARIQAMLGAFRTEMIDKTQGMIQREVGTLTAALGDRSQAGNMELLAQQVSLQNQQKAALDALRKEVDSITAQLASLSSEQAGLPSTIQDSVLVVLQAQLASQLASLADTNKASVNTELADQLKARHDELAAKLEASHKLHQENMAANVAALEAAGEKELAAKLESDQEMAWKTMEGRLAELSAAGKDDLSSQLAAWREQQERVIHEKIHELHSAGHATLAATIAELHDAGQQDAMLKLRADHMELAAKLRALEDEYKKELQVLMAGVAAQGGRSDGEPGANQEQLLHAQLLFEKEHTAALGIIEDRVTQLLSDYEVLVAQLNEAKKRINSHDSTAVAAALVAGLESQLGGLRQHLEELQNSHAAILMKLGSCCKNDSALALFLHQQLNSMFGGGGMFTGRSSSGDTVGMGLNTGDGSSMPGQTDSAFAAWLQDQFTSRDAQVQDLTARLNELLLLQKEKLTGGAGVDMSMHLRSGGGGGAGLTEEQVRLLIREALFLFGADKTGMVDYAMESSGGSIISTRCSETYNRRTAEFSLFGIPLWYSQNSPRIVIQPDMQPGQCWPFRGSQGYLVIELSGLVRPTEFSMEHIPKVMSPTGSIDSAPKDFTVWGLESERDIVGRLLGNYTYNDDGDPLQFFKVADPKVKGYKYIELRIQNNHGNLEYTCLYRFRVHGRLEWW